MSSTEKAEKPKPENSKAEKEKPKPEKKKAPTKVQLEKWSSSINALLSDPDGVEAFRAFLLEMESEGEEGEFTKYIDFYLECEKYKARFKELEDTAKQIFEDYLAVGADKEVGTGGKSVEIENKLEMGLEDVTVFDEPQKKVKQKLADTQYLHFCLDMKNKFI
ncbi:regulator of G-protein signaling 4-like isoform X3 [Panulirus ornatus]|uniref:regulator of G-protein signaling 4-like isoform X3 n=1 Tax=Panulirus ornatus TaxID=150431 RepID=UPI003A86F2AA